MARRYRTQVSAKVSVENISGGCHVTIQVSAEWSEKCRGVLRWAQGRVARVPWFPVISTGPSRSPARRSQEFSKPVHGLGYFLSGIQSELAGDGPWGWGVRFPEFDADPDMAVMSGGQAEISLQRREDLLAGPSRPVGLEFLEERHEPGPPIDIVDVRAGTQSTECDRDIEAVSRLAGARRSAITRQPKRTLVADRQLVHGHMIFHASGVGQHSRLPTPNLSTAEELARTTLIA